MTAQEIEVVCYLAGSRYEGERLEPVGLTYWRMPLMISEHFSLRTTLKFDVFLIISEHFFPERFKGLCILERWAHTDHFRGKGALRRASQSSL
jgi:hypothetical protein